MASFGWNNDPFQTLYFQIGAHHTAIDAHRFVMQQLMDREAALRANHVYRLPRQRDENGKLIPFDLVPVPRTTIEKIGPDLSGDKSQIVNLGNQYQGSLSADQWVVAQCEDEIEFLYDCKARLEAHIGRVPTSRDYFDNKRFEWREELKTRATNFITAGTMHTPDGPVAGLIPAGELTIMRQHPDWHEIQSHIKEVRQLALSGADLPQLVNETQGVLCLTQR